MNRVLGDNFENLLYKIFVSIDEHTSVSEVINLLINMIKLIIYLKWDFLFIFFFCS